MMKPRSTSAQAETRRMNGILSATLLSRHAERADIGTPRDRHPKDRNTHE